MAHFYGTLAGARGRASRLGNKTSGLEVIAASWQGAVETTLYEKDGVDMARVRLIPWHGCGALKIIYEGPVGGVNAALQGGQENDE